MGMPLFRPGSSLDKARSQVTSRDQFMSLVQGAATLAPGEAVGPGGIPSQTSSSEAQANKFTESRPDLKPLFNRQRKGGGSGPSVTNLSKGTQKKTLLGE
jgi:hypothetical protein